MLCERCVCVCVVLRARVVCVCVGLRVLRRARLRSCGPFRAFLLLPRACLRLSGAFFWALVGPCVALRPYVLGFPLARFGVAIRGRSLVLL